MVLFYSALHERGRREKNEDSMALHRMETRIGEVTMALVCDGMGGEQAGEVASGYVVEQLSIWFYDSLPEALQRGYSAKRIRKSLQRTLFRVHEELRQYAAERVIRCGTTLTMLLMIGKRYLLFHCGDSMAFSIRRRICALVPRQGTGSGVERCIGIGRFYPLYCRAGCVRGREGFLLSSDGLREKTGTEDLFGALCTDRIKNREDAERALRNLAQTVLRRGGGDNISALYLRCG
ncbi:MAG: serine/threonine-protein phosphatase [Lachnospiraceae bacterium]|nr:serine/threonine-protein phosphatase [Lachnospiraceae bacterium]